MRSRQSGRMARAVTLGGGGMIGGLGVTGFSTSVFSGGGRRDIPRLLFE